MVDRKAGGLIGGSKDKGKQDFAEKVADFTHSGRTGRKENLALNLWPSAGVTESGGGDPIES